MTRLLYTFTLIFLLVSMVSQAQETDCSFQIKGQVFDLDTKEPLPFVNILIDQTKQGVASDEQGLFEFTNLCEKEYDLEFSYLGYKTIKHHHDFHHPFLEIYLAADGYLLESVVVEAERNPTGLRTISSVRLTQEELEEVASESFGDAVSKIAGVQTLRTGQNVVKPIIHGLHSNRILVMNNGLRHEFQNWGQDHAPEIDPSMIDNLEVIKGASTVRYGPDALGGVIVINPSDMELSTPIKGKVNLTGKSNGRSGEGTIELKKGFKWLSLLGGGSYVTQGDLRAPNYYLTNTGKEESSYYGGVRIHPFAELNIEGYYSHFEQRLGILSGSVFGNLDDIRRSVQVDTPLLTKPFSYDIDKPRQQVQHDLYKASVSYSGNTHVLKLQYGYQINKRQEFGVRRINAPNIDLELVTESLDLDWQHPSFWGLTGRLGGQWLIKANDNQPGTNTVPFIPNYDEERFGVYLIESLALGEKDILEFGMRYDYMDSYIVGREPDNTIYRNTVLYRNFSGTLGYKTQLSQNTFFQTNLGTGWRAPDVAELYRFGQHSFFLEYGLWRYTIDERFDFVSTSQGILTQEDRPVPSEVGYKWINTYTIDRPNFRTELTGYVNYIENYIFSRPAGITQLPRGFFVFYIYEQTDALFWGIDWSGEWTHSDLFESGWKASYLWSKQTETNDFFANQPPPQIEYDFTYKPTIPLLDQTSFKVGLSYTFEQTQHPRIIDLEDFLFAAQNGITRFTDEAADFDILPPPPGFFLVNFAWKARMEGFDWRFEVRNVFNTSYRVYTDRIRYFADDLGRNVVLSMTYRW